MSGWIGTFQVVKIPQIGIGGPAGKGPEPACSWCGEPMSVDSVVFSPLWYQSQTGNSLPMQAGAPVKHSMLVPDSRMHMACAHAMINAMAEHVASGNDRDFSWTQGEFLPGSSKRKWSDRDE